MAEFFRQLAEVDSGEVYYLDFHLIFNNLPFSQDNLFDDPLRLILASVGCILLGAGYKYLVMKLLLC